MTTKRFDLAMSALIGAFFSSALGKGVCTACAVGNMVAKANGVKILGLDDSGHIIAQGEGILAARGVEMGIAKTLGIHSWSSLFITESEPMKSHNWTTLEAQLAALASHDLERDDINAANIVIMPTGYSAGELALVEAAFEANTKISARDYSAHSQEEIKADQFNGLIAVTDVLCQLDGMSIDATAEFKSAFNYVKPPEFGPDQPQLVEQILEEA